MSRYTVFCIKQINNEVILYSTGNYSQYLVITYDGKEYMHVCTCMLIMYN